MQSKEAMFTRVTQTPRLLDVLSGMSTMHRPFERKLACWIEIVCMDSVELFKVSIANCTLTLDKNPKVVVTAIEDVFQVPTHV